MDVERLGEIVGASVATGAPLNPEQVESVLTEEEFLQAAERRGYVLGFIATSEEAADDTIPETPIPIDLFSTLTPEQQERAKAKQVAFAEHFSTPERPLNPEDFGVVAVGEGKNRRTFVMLTTGNGLYKGSYNAIMSNDEDFTVEIDGEAIDTRTAMTWGIYRAFIDQAKADGNPLPDSAALAKENNEPHTATWLTGEKPDELFAYFGYVRGGDADRRWDGQYYGWSGMRVRPGAEI